MNKAMLRSCLPVLILLATVIMMVGCKSFDRYEIDNTSWYSRRVLLDYDKSANHISQRWELWEITFSGPRFLISGPRTLRVFHSIEGPENYTLGNKNRELLVDRQYQVKQTESVRDGTHILPLHCEIRAFKEGELDYSNSFDRYRLDIEYYMWPERARDDEYLDVKFGSRAFNHSHWLKGKVPNVQPVEPVLDDYLISAAGSSFGSHYYEIFDLASIFENENNEYRDELLTNYCKILNHQYEVGVVIATGHTGIRNPVTGFKSAIIYVPFPVCYNEQNALNNIKLITNMWKDAPWDHRIVGNPVPGDIVVIHEDLCVRWLTPTKSEETLAFLKNLPLDGGRKFLMDTLEKFDSINTVGD